MEEDKKPLPGRKIRRPRKNRKAVHKQEGQCFFPMSMSILYGALGDPAAEATPPLFPYNVTFKQVINLVFISLNYLVYRNILLARFGVTCIYHYTVVD